MDVSCILWQGFRKYSVFRRIESKKGGENLWKSDNW